MNPSSVTIIVPAYNEENAIGQVVEKLHEQLPEVEMIIVNDGSTDRTAEQARKQGVEVVDHLYNRGYGAALKTGLRKASRDYVLFCDGDGQHTVEDVKRLIREADGHDMVVGQRVRGSHVNFARAPGKAVLIIFANLLAGHRIPDLNSGLRIFKKDVLMRYLHLMPDGFSFSTTSTFAMLKTNQVIKYVPIKSKARVGTSTVRPLRDGSKSIMLMLQLMVLFESMKVFLSFAAVLFTLSCVSCLNDLLTGDRGVGDTTVTLAVSTLLVFLFGLLCDQISAARREKHE
jgi:glycosyltransferase involved in cell wall biosynthesis